MRCANINLLAVTVDIAADINRLQSKIKGQQIWQPPRAAKVPAMPLCLPALIVRSAGWLVCFSITLLHYVATVSFVDIALAACVGCILRIVEWCRNHCCCCGYLCSSSIDCYNGADGNTRLGEAFVSAAPIDANHSTEARRNYSAAAQCSGVRLLYFTTACSALTFSFHLSTF